MSVQMLPKVSVITGFYNRGHLLERTLEPLLSQTYENLEVIVFDDKSSDDTAERLSRYAERKDPRLKIIIHDVNTGFTRGMLNAIAQSTGEYIAVQGSGDASTIDRIAEQAAVLQNHAEIGVVGSWYENIVEESGVVRLRTPNADVATPESLANGNVFTHGEVMYRRSVFDACGGYQPEFRFCQDYDMWLRMIRICRFATVKKMLYRRYIQFEGVSYAVDKAATQVKYSLIAQRMSRATAERRAEMMGVLRAGGPSALVDDNDPDLQKRLWRNCLRLVAWGNPKQAGKFAAKLSSPTKQAAVRLIGAIICHPLASLPREIIFKSLGIRTASA